MTLFRFFAIIFSLCFCVTISSQTAESLYREGILLIKKAKSEKRNSTSYKKFCNAAIVKFRDSKVMDPDWSDNCMSGINYCERMLKSQSKKTPIMEDFPQYVPVIKFSSKHAVISCEGYSNDTIEVKCSDQWELLGNDKDGEEGGFLSGHVMKCKESLIFNVNANESFRDRTDTLYVKAYCDAGQVIVPLIVTQRGTPITLYFCIDGGETWYSTKYPEDIPAIEVAKFKDEYRSIQIEVSPREAANLWHREKKISIPDWCVLQSVRQDNRSFLQKSLNIGEFSPEIKQKEVYFKTEKQEKKRGTSGVAKTGEIFIKLRTAELHIPIHQNR